MTPDLAPDLEKRLARLTPAQRALYLKRMQRKNLDAEALARRSAERARGAASAGSEQAALAATPIPRRARAEPGVEAEGWPLSLDQERIYFIHHLNPDSPFYNIIGAGRFRGRLRLDVLERAINEVVRRHETLRTRFEVRGGAPVQIVEPRLRMRIPLIDLRGLSASDARSTADVWVSRCLGTAFRLDRLPLGLSVMLQVGDEEFVWPMVYHHIVVDWVSWSLFQREIVLLYEYFARVAAEQGPSSASELSPLPELPIQYADFAVWQRRQLDAGVLASQFDYWREALRGAPEETTLPLDHPRPPMQRGDGRRRFRDLPAEASRRFRELMRHQGVTPFMAFLALFKVLVLRLTGQRRLILGSPTTARNHPDLEALIGYLLYQLPFYTDLSGDPDFEEVLRRVRTSTLGAFDHGDTPFSKLIELVDPERDPRRTPLTQLVLLFLDPDGLNTQLATPALPGVESLPYDFDGESSKFDATFVVWDRPVYHLWIEYDNDLFDATTIDRFARLFGTLLTGVTDDPRRPVRELPLLDVVEVHQLVVERNDVPTPVESGTVESGTEERVRAEPLPGLSLPRRFELWAERQPDAVALLHRRHHLSYGELLRRSAAVASRLRVQGAGVETLVALSFAPSVELFIGQVGILRSGAAYVPVDPVYPEERRRYLVADSGVEVVVDAGWMEQVMGIEKQVGAVNAEATTRPGHPHGGAPTQSSVPVPGRGGPMWPPSEIRGDSTAYVIYTSGSTGQPKGVAMSHHGIARLFDATAGWFDFGPGDVWALFHSFAFDFSVWEIWGALACGGRLVILSEADRRQPARLARWLAEQQVTVLNQTPSAFRGLIPEIWQNTGEDTVDSSLRGVIFGGEALDPQILRECVRRDATAFVNMYGITETAVHTTYRRIRAADTARSSSRIGVPLPDLQLYVLDRWVGLLPLGVPGELVVGGDGLARGYLRRPSLTAQRFIPDPFSRRNSGRRLYRSGDLARTCVDGDLEYLGRIDHQVKVRGYRIELGEVEAALDGHPSVRRAVAEVRKGAAGDGGRLIAWLQVEGAGDGAVDTPSLGQQLGQWLAERLPEHQVPSLLLPVDELPLTTHGKIDRRTLARRPLPDVSTGAVYRPPLTAVERTLCDIFTQVLDVPRVGLDDGFFDLGGDSLLSIRVVGLARDAGVMLELTDLLRHPTVGALASFLAAREEGPSDDVEQYAATQPFALVDAEDRARLPADVEDAYPLARLQAGMLFHMALTDDEPPYHNLDSYRLRGPFDPDAFRRAVLCVVAQQPALRTSFDLEHYRQPLQLVHEEVDPDHAYQLIDLRHLPAAEREATVDTFLEHHRSRPLPLDQPPLVRFVVHWLEQEADRSTFELSVIENHAIFDGWSLHVTLDDIFAEAFTSTPTEAAASKLSPAEPSAAAAVTYRDFVVLERAAEASTSNRAFWQRIVEDAPFLEVPRWPLPPRGEDQLRVPNVTVPLSPTAAEAQQAASKVLGVPVKSVALAAYLAALALWTGSDDIVTSFTANGRPEVPGGDQVRGLFLNSLPLRLHKPRAGSWADLIRRARDAELELLPHRRYPLATLLRELNTDRSSGRAIGRSAGSGAQTQLFEVAFNFVHFHVVDALLDSRLEVLETRIHDVDSTTLVCTSGRQPGSGEPYLQFAWDADEVGRAQVRRLAELFERVYEAMADLERPVASTSVLSRAERHQIVVEWNATPDREPFLDRHMDLPLPRWESDSLHARILHWVRNTPDAVATIESTDAIDQVLTYGELGHRSARLASHLRARGLAPETRVGIFLERSLDVPVALLGVLRAGGAYLPLDPTFPAERLAWLLEDSGAPFVVTSAELRSRLPQAPAEEAEVEVVVLDEVEAFADPVADPTAAALTVGLSDPRQLVYVIHTSGSTGRPKGVCAHHAGVLALLDTYRTPLIAAGARASWWTRLVFDVSVSEIFFPLTNGVALEIAPERLRADASGFLDWQAERRIDGAYVPAFHLAELERRAREPSASNLPPLVHLEVGVEPIAAERLLTIARGLARRSGVEIDLNNGYGPTEVTDCSLAKFVRLWHYQHTPPLRGRTPIGRNLLGGRVYLLDARGDLVLPGVPGEIHLGGAGVTRGYLDRPALTAAAFVPDPFADEHAAGGVQGRRPGARIYRSGDLGRYAPDGDIEFLGRRDHQFKIRGYRVEPGEVEAVVEATPDVEAAAVIVHDSGASVGLRLVAYIVPAVDLFDEADEDKWLKDVQRQLGRQLPEYMVPSLFVLLDALPRNSSGKLNRQALPSPDDVGQVATQYVAPRTAVEDVLTRMWGELLGVEKVGVDDDFFDLGGHSLVATQLVSRIRDIFDLDVPLIEFFELRTVADLAAALVSADEDSEYAEKAARAWLRLQQLSPAERAALLASRE